MGINIPIGANANEAVRAARQAGDAIEGIGDELNGLARDSQRQGDRAGDALADGLKSGAREAGRTAERLGDSIGNGVKDGVRQSDRHLNNLEDSFRDAVRASKRESADIGDGLGKSVKKGTDEAGEGLSEFKDEANSTAKEAAASFDGSAESIGDAFQEVAANAFVGFGPAGLAAGLLVAAGLGTAFAKIQEGQEDTEAFREKVAELGAEFIEAGGKGEASLGFVIDKLKELATNTEDGVVNLEALQEAVEGAGNGKNFEDIARAVAGAGENVDDLLDSQKKYLKQLEEESTTVDQSVSGAYKAAIEKVTAQQLVVEELEKAKTAADVARAGEEAYAAAGGDALQAKADLINSINDAYDEAAGGAEDYVDAESGIFDVQGFIDSMAQREQALKDYQETLATAALTPSAKAFISSQGVDSAATFMAGYKTATPAQQAELNRIWSEAGKTSSGSFSSSTRASLSNANFAADVDLRTNPGAIQTALNSRNYSVTVAARVESLKGLPSGVQGMGVP